MDSKRSCQFDPVGEDITLAQYNEERWKHLKFVESFKPHGLFNILCDWCGQPLIEEHHLQGTNHAEGVPKVQMFCKGCKHTAYKII